MSDERNPRHIVLQQAGVWGRWDYDTGAMAYDDPELFAAALQDPPSFEEVEHEGTQQDCPRCHPAAESGGGSGGSSPLDTPQHEAD